MSSPKPPHRCGRLLRGNYVGCIAGALSISEYRDAADAGFTDIDISPTHQVADGMYSAIIRTTKPAPCEDRL
jgi:arsenite methyltransferase